MQPVRSADYPSHPSLSQSLTLPADTAVVDASLDDALAAWRAYLGFDGPLVLAREPQRARIALLQTVGVAAGEPVGLPVNCRRFLSEATKRAGGVPRFIELDRDLAFVADTPGIEDLRVIWAQPVGGMAAPAPLPGRTMLVDHGLTLPAPLDGQTLPGAATLWGLHLGGDAPGALIAFADGADAERFQHILAEREATVAPLDPGRVLAQCARLRGPDGLTARLDRIDLEARLGMEAGAGLPMAERAIGALPYGLPVRIPDEAELATFIAYTRNELVALDWLPETQPLFYVAFQVTNDVALTRRSGEHLARWVISPLGPDFVDDEITHAVLGILKAAEYTGVRWYTDPGRARWYGELMVEWYGASHDAFHPAFAITVPAAE